MESEGTFGAFLRSHRLAAQLTQEELAERAGLSTRSISDLERGINLTARKQTAILLADALQLEGVPRSRFTTLARGRTLGPEGSPVRGNAALPTPLTPLLGRERQVAEIVEVLADGRTRLLTLVGPGGVGKTRLALEVGHRARGPWGAERAFVSLEHVGEDSQIPHAVARALGVRESSGVPYPAALAERIGNNSLLLLLDNWEQVAHAGPFLSLLLATCPGLTAVVTSRSPLGLRGEHRYPVPPLAVEVTATDPDGSGSPAVALFLQRATAGNPHTAYGSVELAAVAQICRRLDGLPLAIELAAARTSVLGPVAILDRLSHPLQLLVGGPRDAPARHRALVNTLAWSYDLLDEAAATVFRRAAIFAGGFTLEAAEQVCALQDNIDVLDAVAALAEGSLLQRSGGPGGQSRFAMLQTVRDFAQDQLATSGEQTLMAAAHASYLTRLLAQAALALTGPEQGHWLTVLDDEHLNALAALQHALTSDNVELALGLAGQLWRYWEIRGQLAEGRYWLQQALALPGGSATARAVALRGAGNLARDQGDYAAALQAQELSLTLCRAASDRAGEARCLNNLGNIALDQGESGTAAARYAEAQNLGRGLGDDLLVALTTHNLALALRRSGDIAGAVALLHRSLEAFGRLGDDREVARCRESLGRLASAQGRSEEAMTHHVEALRLRMWLGDRAGLARSLEGVVIALIGLGDDRRAATLLGAARRLREQIAEAYTADEHADNITSADRLTEELGEEDFDAALEQGRASPIGDLLGWLGI